VAGRTAEQLRSSRVLLFTVGLPERVILFRVRAT
jgi:hypothetical protein